MIRRETGRCTRCFRAHVFRCFITPMKVPTRASSNGQGQTMPLFLFRIWSYHHSLRLLYVCMGRMNSSLKMSRRFEEHQVEMPSTTINYHNFRDIQTLTSMKFQMRYQEAMLLHVFLGSDQAQEVVPNRSSKVMSACAKSKEWLPALRMLHGMVADTAGL